MTRYDRNILIEQSLDPDRIDMINISSALGDDDTVDLDWDDLLECTSTKIRDEVDLEELLQSMYDLDILEILDFENGEIG